MWLSLLKVIPAIVSLLGAMWRYFVSAKDRALGRAEATADALKKQAEQNKQAVDAANEAEAAHSAKPDTDDAFDADFKRKD